MKRLAIVLGLLSSTVLAQTTPGPATYVQIRTAPTVGAACTSNQTVWVPSTRRTYCCPSGAWAACDAPADCAANPPVGACNSGQTCVRTDTGALYVCQSSAWVASAITSSGTSGTVQVSNGSGGLTAITRQKIYCGYADLDTNGDGTADVRDQWDYDCDSTQESSDINTAGDYLCAPADGVTQLATRLSDLDGDGSVDDLVCGTLEIAPGTYTSGSTYEPATDRIIFPWQGLKVRGSGMTSTIVSVDFPRGTSVNPDQAGSLCGQSTQGAFVSMSGSYSEIEDLSIISTLIKPRTTVWGSGGDCDLSGTAEGTTDNSYLRLFELTGSQDSNPIVYTHARRLRVLNSDQSCVYAQYCNHCSLTWMEAGFCGEHAFAATTNDGLYDHLYGHDVSNPLSGGYGIELFNGGGSLNGELHDNTVSNSLFERVKRGIFTYSSEKGFSHTIIHHNTVRTTRHGSTPGSTQAVCIAIGGGAGGTNAISDTVITDNDVSDCGANGIELDGGTNPLKRALVANNIVGNVGVDVLTCPGGECGTQIKVTSDPDTADVIVSGNQLTPGATTMTGIIGYGVRTQIDGNRISGKLDVDIDENGTTDGRYAGIYVGSTCTQCAVRNNYIALDQPVDIASSDIAYGIHSDGADDLLVDSNTILFTNATEANHQNKIGIRALTGSDRIVVTNNKVFGGMRAFASEAGANNHVLLMNNYGRSRYTSNGVFSLFQSTSSVATNNVCSSNTTGAAPQCILQEADTIMQGNVAFGTVAFGANAGTTVNGRGDFVFGDDTNAAFDTGTEVCAARGKTCKTAFVRTAAAAGTINEIACGTDAGATLANEEFWALCY